MLRQGLKAIQPAGFKPKTTDSGHDKRVSPNLLKGLKDEGRQVIVGDITYVPSIADNWVYLAKFQDRETKRVVGWKMSRSLEAGIVIGALRNAIASGHISRGAIVHTDRGSQYTDDDYRDLLKAHSLQQSMSAKGNCYENAQAESFFARYKTELLEGGVFADFDEAVSETFSYIDGYYNIHRRHSGIGYLTPAEYELRKLSETGRRSEPVPEGEGSEQITSNETRKGGKRVRVVSEIT
jgi:transposase InsO family protein